jgi:hypothetical protein
MKTALLLLAGLFTGATAFGQPERSFNPRRVIPNPLPAITNAATLPADRAGAVVTDHELVLGVSVGGESRAYPINQLTGPRREIINDELGGRAIAATW